MGYRGGLDGAGGGLDHLVQTVDSGLVDVQRVIELHEHLLSRHLREQKGRAGSQVRVEGR